MLVSHSMLCSLARKTLSEQTGAPEVHAQLQATCASFSIPGFTSDDHRLVIELHLTRVEGAEHLISSDQSNTTCIQQSHCAHLCSQSHFTSSLQDASIEGVHVHKHSRNGLPEHNG